MADSINDLIGLLAYSIRADWGPSNARIKAIESLMKLTGVEYEIDYDSAFGDGRWWRDCWQGPYIEPDVKILKSNYVPMIWYKYIIKPLLKDGKDYSLRQIDPNYKVGHATLCNRYKPNDNCLNDPWLNM